MGMRKTKTGRTKVIFFTRDRNEAGTERQIETQRQGGETQREKERERERELGYVQRRSKSFRVRGVLWALAGAGALFVAAARRALAASPRVTASERLS